MSRLINRLYGRVYGWFDAKEARSASKPIPPQYRNRARFALLDLEDRLVPNTYTVTSLTDTNSTGSGVGSGTSGDLRFCITQANANAGDDTIQFDPAFSSGVNVIALGAALPAFTGAAANNLTIQGPGADHMIITRGTTAFNRVMLVNSSASSTYLISGLTLTGFSGTTAGAAIGITTAGQTVTLDGLQIVGNSTSTTGGAIDIGAASDVTIRNSTIAGNYAGLGGGGVIVRRAKAEVFCGCDPRPATRVSSRKQSEQRWRQQSR